MHNEALGLPVEIEPKLAVPHKCAHCPRQFVHRANFLAS